jgi:glutamate transport system substrate-binding protein
MALTTALLVALAACTSEGSASVTPRPTASRAPSPQSTAATSASCTSSSALVIGVKVDQYGTGYLDVRNYSYSGFDVAIAGKIASAVFHVNLPYFLPVTSDTREEALSSCAVRFFVATYTSDTQRQQEFDIAAPYLVTFQGVMVGPKSPRIQTAGDLNGKTVCTVGGGSEAASILMRYAPRSIPVMRPTYSDCLSLLRQGDVEAFSTDLAILYGYLNDPADAGSHLSIVANLTLGNPIFYGVAFRKSDHQLCLAAANEIKALVDDGVWPGIFSANLGNYNVGQWSTGLSPEPTDQEIQDNSCKTPPPGTPQG